MKDVTAVNEARQFLSETLKPGDTIFTVLTHVSRSGMQRRIQLVYFVNKEADNIRYIAYHTSKLLGRRWDENDGIVVNGCGMDMGFELVYELGIALHKNGYAFKHRWL